MTTDVLHRRDTHLRLGCRSSQYVDRGVIGQCQLMSTQAKLYGQQDTTMNVYWSTVPGRVSGTEFASQRLLGHGKSPESRRWRRGVRHLIQPSWPRVISRKPYIIFEGSPVATTSPEAWSFANVTQTYPMSGQQIVPLHSSPKSSPLSLNHRLIQSRKGPICRLRVSCCCNCRPRSSFMEFSTCW